MFKLLLIGDSGVGKSSLLLRFTSDSFDDLSPTIGTYLFIFFPSFDWGSDDFMCRLLIAGNLGWKLKLEVEFGFRCDVLGLRPFLAFSPFLKSFKMT